MLAVSLVAFLLVFGLLVMGPHLSDWVGSATGWESAVQWIWWAGQWPILAAGLLAVFATLLYLGPDVEHRRWAFVTPGAIAALAIWLVASGGFSLYVTYLGSYNATWGALGAVVVMLTWLWLSTLALLFGAEIDSERGRRANI
jgi:membrane protein